MRAGWASGGVAEAVTHGGELANGAIEVVGLGDEQLAIDVGLTVARQHARDFVQRETGGAAERDEGETIEHLDREEPSQATPTVRANEPLIFVESQRGGRKPRAPPDLADIQMLHVLDLKWT